MPTPPLSDDLARQAWAAYVEHGSKSRAAEALGWKWNTFAHRWNIARSRGLHLSEGAQQAVNRVKLSGVEAKGGWIHDYDEDGKKVGTVRWSAGEAQETDLIDRIREAFADVDPAPVIPAPEYTNDQLVTVYPIADRHQGLKAWGKEIGEDYDQKIAANRMKDWMGHCVAASPASETAIILDIGDGEHIDDATNQTPRSKHTLDADGRVFLTVENSIATLAFCVEAALAKHASVVVRILPGNHNPTLYLAVMFGLAERYRENPRVDVQKVPGEFFVKRFGRCLFAAHHGDKAKAERLVTFVADEFAEEWGKTRHRFLWTGHLHHHKSADIGGMKWEQLRAVTARDAYAFSHAYSARAQLQAITFHRDQGEVQRVSVGCY
jgi:hypothetical protein